MSVFYTLKKNECGGSKILIAMLVHTKELSGGNRKLYLIGKSNSSGFRKWVILGGEF
jgi:hypothetical protein